MWIKSFKKMYNTDHISKIEVSERGNLMVEVYGMPNTFPLVHYSSFQKAEWVYEMLYLAMKDGDEVFEIPGEKDIDLDYARQHTSHCTNRNASHGRS